MISRTAALTIAAGVVGAGVPAGAAPSDDVDFVRDVRPILSQHCFACHGPDHESRQAGLSLVAFETATAELEPGVRAIVPGARERSMLWERINDARHPMPPRSAHNALSPSQIDTLGRWIDAGASYAPHWAYVPPAATPVPDVGAGDWPLDEIDRYILRRLEADGVAPAPDADDVTLLRRVTYDLTGLPPTPGEIDAFLADDGPDAFERVVDRLLASPHFGERMAVYWLDLVRFADTVGYHGDQDHFIWPYRDYVIDAFNDNLPFDRFTIEQLAGDLLDEPTQDQIVATGYNRLLQTSHEGGVQLKEYRAIYMADRVRNVSQAWMGATVGCAQCHDHKYDPYTTRDFYALGAFFADIDDEEHLRNQYDGLNTLPTRRTPMMRVTTEASRRRTAEIAVELEAAQRELDAAVATAEPTGRGELIWVDDELDTGGEIKGTWTFLRLPEIEPHRGEKYRRQTSDALVQHYSVKTTRKTIEISDADEDVFFAWVYLHPGEPPSAVMLQFNVDGSWEHRAVWGNDDIPYGRRDESWVGYQRQGELPPLGEWVALEVTASAVGLAPGEVVSGIAFSQFGGTVFWDDAGARVLEVPAAVASARSRMADLEREQREIEASLPQTMYTRALDEPREVRVLPRGNWLDETGEIVTPAVPAFLGAVDVDGTATRLDLATWLVTPEDRGGVGGLTARVLVNRVWAMLFGAGLCPSPEDFGGQGLPPNHPELLDRLALDFVASGWDVKMLVERLVRTRTYRQATAPTSEVATRDPLNHLFARHVSRRLPAEMIRDTALAVSGLLVDDVGGPSVKPPQPEGYYRHLNFPPRRYMADTGAGQWRRGVYVHWQRQYLHPMLLAFDAPTREECTAQRSVSNTPLAALTLLNDPTFVEASRAFAQRVLADDALADDRERLVHAMRLATARRPTPAEAAILNDLLRESRRHYAEHRENAEALLAIGLAPRDAALDMVEHAAWTQVARAILNLHETITLD